MKKFIIFCMVWLGLFVSFAGADSSQECLDFLTLPDMPNIGLAGAFAGVVDDRLVVAGGANFPDGRPWDGCEKVWHDDVYTLALAESTWKLAQIKLPSPIAYGVSLPWENSVICIGGGNKNNHSSGVFAIKSQNGVLEIEQLPSLPRPLAFMCGAILDGVVYITGGIETPDSADALKLFLSLDLNSPLPERKWKELSPWPGKGRMLAVAGVQDGKYYLFGGVELVKDENGKVVRRYLTDGYSYAPDDGWSTIADLPYPVASAVSPAMAIGPSHLAIFGCDDGSNAYKDLKELHPGFRKDILGYHTITNTWSIIGSLADTDGTEIKASVTTNSVLWGSNYVVPTGEIRPGVRTPKSYMVSPKAYKGDFGFIDYTIVIIYLLGLLVVGFYFSKREKGTDDYFKGGGRVPWWAAGLSVFATMLSAITFMAIPAKAYASDWTYFLANISLLILAPFVIRFYLPFYRRLNVTSAYEYLEVRFNLAVRIFGSLAFALFQMGRMAVVLFLPAIALATVSPINVYTCILIMGVLCIIYTVMGGIEAVIWTDAIQSIILLVGAIISIVIIVLNCDGGFTGVIDIAMDSDKFHMFDWSWDYTMPVVWVVVLGSILSNIAPYTSDQAVVQRYLTTSDEKKAAKAIWMNAWISIPASMLFFCVGTALFVFYKIHTNLLAPTISTDAIYPLFIVKQLPVGIAGLVIAGLFAAAQSTLSSSLNSLATVFVEDFYKRFKKNPSDHSCLVLARILTLVIGIFGISTALMLATMDVKSLWDVFLKLLGLFGGGLAGLFFLGIFTKKTNSGGALFGAIFSAVILLLVQRYTEVHFFLYGGIGIATCVIAGYLASFVIPSGEKNLSETKIDKSL